MEKGMKLVKVEANKKQIENIQPHVIALRVNTADFNVRAPKARYNKYSSPQLVRKMTVQDIISLIKKVEGHPVLWDKTSKEYTNKKIKNFTWANIALKLGFSSDQLKEKWKCLTDMFTKDYDKCIQYNMNCQSPKNTKWLYLNSMSFLRDIKSQCLNELSDKEQNEVKSSKRKTKDVESISSENQQFYADEDYNFLLSLLQPLKRIPTVKKTSFKLKLLELICKEENYAQNQGNFDKQYATCAYKGHQGDQ